MRLSDRIAVVTGAGRGIGAAIACRLAAEGARVVLADLNADGLETVRRSIEATGGIASAIGCDVTGPDTPERLVEAARALGGLDILVNNAGVASMGWIESVTEPEYERLMAVNVKALLRLTGAAVPWLKRSGRGRIVNLASVEGIRGSGLLPLYCLSKHAVVGLTRANAVELGRFGVTVNCLCPGPIDTDMLAPIVSTPELREKTIRHVPARRLGTPEDIAGAALFLASDDAAYVNGHTLVVDGGMTADA